MMIALWVSHSGRCRYDGSSYYLCSKIYSILVTPRTHFILETFATLTFAISTNLITARSHTCSDTELGSK